MSNDPSPAKKKARWRADDKDGIGDSRYGLIQAVAKRTSDAMNSGFYLEANTLIESLISERLEKRAQWLYHNAETAVAKKSLKEVKDGFTTLHVLIAALRKTEPDAGLLSVLAPIDEWRKSRNKAIHEMAKLGDGAETSWENRYAAAHDAAKAGVELVLRLDLEERRVSHASRARVLASATCPDALAPLGQPSCEWCE